MSRMSIMPLIGASINPKDRNQFAQTPEEIYKILDDEFHFEFDPCPPEPDFNGLTVDWKKINFVNPPYNDLKPWLRKGIKERDKGNTSVFLIPARVTNQYFHELVLDEKAELRFIRGRLTFKGYKRQAPFGSIVVIYKPTEK